MARRVRRYSDKWDTLAIEGLDDVLEELEVAPDNAFTIMKKSARSAGTTVKKYIMARTPSRWKKLVKSSTKSRKKDAAILQLIGLFHTGAATGHQGKKGKTYDWYKAYWNNYGTLGRRDPAHKFDNPVRHRGKSRNRAGVRPKRFFESASQGATKVYENAFVSAFNKNFKLIVSK